MKAKNTDRYLITSALPYINGIKHLGNLIGSILPADVYARYLRSCGKNVLYICGTDDYGAPAEIAAKNAGLSIRDYCDNMHQRQKDIYEQFAISFDYFGRSSSKTNTELTQALFKKLDEHGFIFEKTIEQYYSIDDGRFLPDRFIVGVCPHCNYEAARGDQCDGCGSLLDPAELVNPKSSLTASSPLELRQTAHLFLDLPKLSDRVRQWSKKIEQPSKLLLGILKKWLDEDKLEARCITRDLSWGIPVPKPGFEDKVFYVWFDAPNGYISMTIDFLAAQGHDDWQSWWKSPDTVHYTQFMAKDNVPFHAVFWPAMLLGSEEDWTMVNHLKAFNWLNYEGGKFSTSQGRGVFSDQALTLFPADYWRYYLLANAPESSDSSFTFTSFVQTINSDLADNLGNFVSRVLALVEKYFASAVPCTITQQQSAPILGKVTSLLAELDDAYNNCQFRLIVNKLKSLWMLGNSYIAEQEPWKQAKSDKESAAITLSNCLHLMRVYAITMHPVMPQSAQALWHLLNLPGSPSDVLLLNAFDINALNQQHPVSQKTVLFAKIPVEKIEELNAKFS